MIIEIPSSEIENIVRDVSYKIGKRAVEEKVKEIIYEQLSSDKIREIMYNILLDEQLKKEVNNFIKSRYKEVVKEIVKECLESIK